MMKFMACSQAGVKSPLVMLANCKYQELPGEGVNTKVMFSWLAIWYLSQVVFIPLSVPEIASEPCGEVTHLPNTQIMYVKFDSPAEPALWEDWELIMSFPNSPRGKGGGTCGKV